MPVAAIAVAAALAAGGSLEARSGSARLERDDGRLVLHSGIRARCGERVCSWRLSAWSRGRRVGTTTGLVIAGRPRELRLRLGPRGSLAFAPGRRVPVVIDARLTPPDGERIGLERRAFVRAPR